MDQLVTETSTTLDPRGLDPRAVPLTSIAWSSAMRLRAARLPSKDSLRRLAPSAEAYDALELLADWTDSRRRVVSREIGHVPTQDLQDLDNCYPGIFYQKVEWPFNDGTKPGFVVAKNLQAALDHAQEAYGGFLKDSGTGPMTMQFIVDRMKVEGQFHDLTDMDSFGAFYQSDDWKAGQATAANLLKVNSQGFLFGFVPDQTAVITDVSVVSAIQAERAIALKWDGRRFVQLFDYRDLYWKDL